MRRLLAWLADVFVYSKTLLEYVNCEQMSQLTLGAWSFLASLLLGLLADVFSSFCCGYWSAECVLISGFTFSDSPIRPSGSSRWYERRVGKKLKSLEIGI